MQASFADAKISRLLHRLVRTGACVFVLRMSVAAGQHRSSTVLSGSVEGWKQIIGRGESSAVMVDVSSGAAKTTGAVDGVSLPGSTLKPLVLQLALAAHVVSAQSLIECRGEMRVGRFSLACSHPRAITVQDAEMALANSCNTYFATVARQMRSADLVQGLATYGVRAERTPVTPDDRALLALGVANVEVSPRQLASAYRRLAIALNQNNKDDEAIRNGLMESVRVGMAHAAQTGGVLLGGKTGSAHDSTAGGQHGWFAGIVFVRDGNGSRAARVLVVQVAGGNGNDAALLAHRLLESMH